MLALLRECLRQRAEGRSELYQCLTFAMKLLEVLKIAFQDDVLLDRTIMPVSPNGSNKRIATLEDMEIHRVKVIQELAISEAADILVLIMMVVVEAAGGTAAAAADLRVFGITAAVLEAVGVWIEDATCLEDTVI